MKRARQMMIKEDLHVHSRFSHCADHDMNFSTMVGRALERHIETIGFTDHPHNNGLAAHHVELASFRERCAAPISILIGAELEVIAPGRLIVDPADLPLADYLLAAPSHYDLASDPPVDDLRDARQWGHRILRDFQWVLGSGAAGVAHPFYVFYLIVRDADEEVLPHVGEVLECIDVDTLQRTLEAMRDEGIALELSRRLNSHPTFEEFMGIVYAMARDIGVRFFTGSDAHQLDVVGMFPESLRQFIDSLDLKEEHLWHP